MLFYKDLQDFKQNNPNLFKNHNASIIKLDGNEGRDCIIEFKQPDTNAGKMTFTYIDGVLSISGDYGYAMFDWYNKNNHILVYPTFTNLGYVLEKCRASEDYYKFDEDLFFNNFREWRKQLVEDGYIESVDEIEEPFGMESSCDARVFFNDLEGKISDLWEHGVYDFGRYINERPFIWWHGLQIALEKLEQQGVFS